MAPLPKFICSGAGDATENQPGTPRSSPASPARSPHWGSRGLSRSIPAEIRITRHNAPSATKYTASPASEDAPCTVRAPTAPDDLLPADPFPGWALDRRSQVSFDGPGGVATLEHAEVV